MNPGNDFMGQLRRGLHEEIDCIFQKFYFKSLHSSFSVASVAHSTRVHSDQLCGAACCINMVIVPVTEVFNICPKITSLVWRTGHNHTNHATLFLPAAMGCFLSFVPYAVVQHTTSSTSLYVKNPFFRANSTSKRLISLLKHKSNIPTTHLAQSLEDSHETLYIP